MQNIELTKEQAAILRDITLEALLNAPDWKKKDLERVAQFTQTHLNQVREKERAKG